jgi:rod shape determining protein RodA
MYFVEKTKGNNYIKQFDYVLFITVLVLSLIGIVVLMSAMGIDPRDPWNTPNAMTSWIKQLICLIIGIASAFVLCAIDYKDYKTIGFALYVLCVFLLVLVLLFGKVSYGAKSWLVVPIIGQFQPSELMKVAYALVLPVFLERLKEDVDKKKNLIKFVIYTAIPLILILRQPDVGTALVFVSSLMVLLFVYGVRYRYFLIAAGAGIASMPIMWFFVFPKHIKDRIMIFLNPELDLLGRGLQVYRSKMTIGSGRIFGNSLFKGIQTQNSSPIVGVGGFEVPLKQNDFIFSVVGEELGFIGCMVVITLILIILLRCLYIAKNSRDLYGNYVVMSITGMFAFHFFENIGMTIGVVPVTGITLPFMSQGGSALITNWMSVGVLLSVSMRRKRALFDNNQ